MTVVKKGACMEDLIIKIIIAVMNLATIILGILTLRTFWKYYQKVIRDIFRI